MPRVVFQLLSYVRLFAAPWPAVHQASLCFIISWSLLKLTSIKLVLPSNPLILCHSLLLPSIFPSIRVFSNGSVLCIRWPKYWSFSFGISPSKEYSGLISFRMDWFVLFAGQGTLKFILQHHSSKASICMYISRCKIEPMSLESPTLASKFFTTETSRKPLFCILGVIKSLFAYIQLLFISTVPLCSFLLW